jgi:16S rRNA processing protein RimM
LPTDRTLIRVGRVGRPHGLRGEVTLDDVALSPLELHALRTFTWRGARGETRALTLATVRPATRHLLVRFEGCDDREAAAALSRGELMVERERLPDPGEKTAYTFQLLGLRVETEEGRVLGTVADIVATGAHPIYVVRGERELLVPAAPGVLQRVSLAEGRVVVRLPAGLEEIAGS